LREVPHSPAQYARVTAQLRPAVRVELRREIEGRLMPALRPVRIAPVVAHVRVPGIEENGAVRRAGRGDGGQTDEQREGQNGEPQRPNHPILLGFRAESSDHRTRHAELYEMGRSGGYVSLWLD